MNPINVPALARRAHPVVQIQDGQAITTSVEVARVFERRHDDVLRTIKNLLSDLSADHARNFAEMVIDVEIGSGATRKSPAYQLTRDGFTLLAFGFTGKKAMAFKLAYIDAFNRMEAELSGNPEQLPAPDHIADASKKAIAMNDTLSDTGITPDMVADIVASTTQNLVATLQQKRKLIAWPEVIEALQNPKTDMAFPDLTALTHACLNRLQRNIDAEAYSAIARRAAHQGVGMQQVSLSTGARS